MNSSSPLSLLQRWLITQLVVGVLIVGAVSLVAWQMSASAAESYFQSRVQATSAVVKRPSFPLTTSVLETISALTQSELAIVNDRGQILESTLDADFDDAARKGLSDKLSKVQNHRVGWIELIHTERGPTEAQECAVLVPERQLSQSRNQAAFLPIVTGSILSIAFAIVATWQFSRIVNRIQAIGKLVKRIGEGDYQAVASVSHSRRDELTALSEHVQQMSNKLRESEVTLRRTERDRILNQMARGLSHDFKKSDRRCQAVYPVVPKRESQHR
jgi:methyl-accepting chemotaxis protein